MRRSGANTARTSVCCGRSANSPSRSRGSTPDSISRTVRPTSSLRPNSDSTGMSDGFCRRVSSTSPFCRPISCGQRRRDEHAVDRGESVEIPEALVDAVDQHAAGAPAGRLQRHEAIDRDHRRGGRRAQLFAGKRGGALVEEGHRGDDLIGAAQASEREIAQAAPHRVADDQRTRQHRHRGRDAEHDGQVGAPMVTGARNCQIVQCHCGCSEDSLFEDWRID